MMRRLAALVFTAMAAFVGAACDRPIDAGPGRDAAAKGTCPPCECVCDCKGEAPAAAGNAGGTAVVPDTDIADLAASASRKMNHGDGKGCLADLDAMKAVDAKMDERLAVTRGQCEMLAGECQKGKDRIARWYQVETAMTPERAATTAEQLASMRCRGGDSSDRDRLLAALFNLSDGAYMNKRDTKYCRTNLDVAKRLIPVVKPTGPDDTQISGGAQALFHTAASCFARAGNCSDAFAAYEAFFPDSPAKTAHPTEHSHIVRESFESSIPLCAGKAP